MEFGGVSKFVCYTVCVCGRARLEVVDAVNGVGRSGVDCGSVLEISQIWGDDAKLKGKQEKINIISKRGKLQF